MTTLEVGEQPRTLLERALFIGSAERLPVAWSTAYFFFLIAGNSVLKPMRDAAGLKDGIQNLRWIMTVTLVGMLIAIPAYNFAISRLPRTRVALAVHRAAQLGAASFLLWGFAAGRWGHGVFGVAFFVWHTVFNLLGVAAFRTLMADVWRERQAKRVFCVIGVGGTLGVVVGAALARRIAHTGAIWPLLPLSVVLFELGIFSLRRTLARFPPPAEEGPRTSAAPGSTASALRLVLTIPVLRSMAAFVALTSVVTTLFYFEQANVVRRAFATDAQRVEAFATIDMIAASATILVGLLLAARFIRRLGARRGLIFLPVAAALSFALLRMSPTFLSVVIAQSTIRSFNFGIVTPARESMFTELSRELNYRGKSVIDTLAWRTGDFIGTWATSLTAVLGVSVSVTAAVAVVVWSFTAFSFADPNARGAA